MWHKPCRTFHPWCPCIKTRCLSPKYARQIYGCEGSPEYVTEDDIVLGIRSISDATITDRGVVCKSLASMRDICLRLDKHRNEKYNVMTRTRHNFDGTPYRLEILVDMLHMIIQKNEYCVAWWTYPDVMSLWRHSYFSLLNTTCDCHTLYAIFYLKHFMLILLRIIVIANPRG